MTAPHEAASAGQALALALGLGRDRLGDLDDPMRDARLLLAHAAGCERGALSRLEVEDFTPEVMTVYLALIDQRAAGRPVSKILGYRDFWNHRFAVTEDVLDPRPDTETLVEAALAQPFERVLDLGTGSGCILLSLLAERPRTVGLGTDISEAALNVARQNAGALGVLARADFAISDWFAAVAGRFDLIVSNPPYIALAEIPGLAREVRMHDPRMALTDEGDGLAAYRAITAQAGHYLRPRGRILLEIGPTQGPEVAQLLSDAGFDGVEILPDLDSRDRVVGGVWPI
ncbi:[protein release factor]-glutamine N5-methyltransferase [Roseovarius marisflavi]|uniref:Release factor glutamine methyltransferase n=1 Tax=Roseovarius marisflavi TaxID=1054996 RepID=A0A1M6ZHH2_9RHOB|nr:peptide chain release factor N(5)-glutamine methyltransferase [Roseovarius marisflavi]SHL29917.1 [protein release factor]-glutamine N5-methyltransferase [Roseovarius marisflavi]